MDSNIFCAYESYVLNNNNSEESLKGLVPNSDSYNYLYLLDLLKKKGFNLSKDEMKSLEHYIGSKRKTSEFIKIELRSLLLEYDSTKNPSRKAEILDTIRHSYLKFNFKHTRPHQMQAKVKDTAIGEQEIPYKLEDDFFNLNTQLQELYAGRKEISEFSQRILREVDIDKLRFRTFESYLRKFPDCICKYNLPKLWNRILAVESQWEKNNLLAILFDNMTISQLNEFFDKYKSKLEESNSDKLIHQIINKILLDQARPDNDLTLQQYRERLQEALKILEHNIAKFSPHMNTNLLSSFVGLKGIVMMELLSNGELLNIYDSKIFLKLLEQTKSHISMESILKESSHKFEKSLALISGQNLKTIYQNILNYSQMVRNYAQKLLQKKPKIEKLLKTYLPGREIDDFKEENHFLQGKKIEINIVNASKYEALSRAVWIKFQPWNKTEFKTDEEVILDLELKNVPLLMLKVFEINMENYYLTKKTELKSDINLDGLVAFHEEQIEFKHSPQIRFTHQFKIPELNNSRGTFIIELIGNGKSARAILKKGHLLFIQNTTHIGHVGVILDENENICKSSNTGIWVGEEFFKSNPDTGEIVIPYATTASSRQTILIDGNLAHMITFQRKKEEYSLKCGFVLFPECVVTGKKAKILVKPTLLINKRIADIHLVKNPKCIISTKFVDNVTTSKEFTDIELNENHEIIIDFEVPSFLLSFSVLFQAQVSNTILKVSETLMQSCSIPIQGYYTQENISDFFLRLNNDNYELYVLGKNGEAIPDSIIDFNFTCEDFTYGLNKTLKSDARGKIDLGSLKGVKEFSTSKSVWKRWKIPSKIFIQYPSEIRIIEDQNIELDFPYDESIFQNECHYLIKKNNLILEDYSKFIKYQKSEDSIIGCLQIKGLKTGYYQLYLGKTDTIISIEVLRGHYWNQDQNVLITKQTIFQKINQNSTNQIHSIQFKEVKEPEEQKEQKIQQKEKGEKRIVLKLKKFTPSARVHMFAFQFLPTDIDEFSKSLYNASQCGIHQQLYTIPTWSNFYFSNRELSTEYKYVFNRRIAQRMTGNSLDKPKLLLKRYFKKTTTFTQQRMDEGQTYPSQKIIADSKQSYAIESKYSGSSDSSNQAFLYQNFLKHTPVTLFNMEPNENGEILIRADFSNFSNLFFMVVDKQNISHFLTSVPNHSETIKKRNMTLSKALDSTKNLCEIRNVILLPKQESHILDDLSHTTFQFVDSLDKLFQILKELGGADSKTDLEKFEFLTKWDSLSLSEKNKKLSFFSSHELHIFLKYKDPMYFAEVVAPYLENKMEKQLIDYALLDHTSSLEKYLSIRKYEELNVLEKILLLDGIKTTNPKTAKQIANEIKNKSELIQRPLSKFNKLFDTVLSANVLKEKQDIEEMIETMAKEQNVVPNKKMRRTSARLNRFDSADYQRQDFEALSCCYSASRSRSRSRRSMRSSVSASYSDYSDDNRKQKIISPTYSPRNISLRDRIDFGSGASKSNLQQEIEETIEYNETQYFKSDFGEFTKKRVTSNPFWGDLSAFLADSLNQHKDKSFLSSNFIYSVSNFTEIMGVLSFIDLPFHSSEHGYKSLEGNQSEIKASSNIILFKRDVKETEITPAKNVLVAQKYFQPFKLSHIEKDEVKEFVKGNIYGCEVIITNTFPKKEEFQILVQVPEGSIPLKDYAYQKSHPFPIKAYSTINFSYLFYFPYSGKFKHFPATVSLESRIVGQGEEAIIEVASQKTIINKENFIDVLSTGSPEDILEFMRNNNFEKVEFGFDLSYIFWLLKDKKFYDECTNILKEKKIFNKTVWSYGLFHKDDSIIKEYFESDFTLKNHLGYYFNCSLLKLRPEDMNIHHLDYFPLVNPRCHSISYEKESEKMTSMFNEDLKKTYSQLILYLMEKNAIDYSIKDKMSLTYYLLLQDRIDEALKIYNSISPATFESKSFYSSLKIQYHYMTAYLDFFTGAPSYNKARELAKLYENYPLLNWRLLFLEVSQKLKEYDEVICQSKSPIQQEKKETEGLVIEDLSKQFQLKVKDKDVFLEYTQLDTFQIKYYLIDTEVLFSRNPLFLENIQECSLVRPNYIDTLILKKEPFKKSNLIPIPSQYKNSNLVVEVTSENIKHYITRFSAAFQVEIFSTIGGIRVTDNNGIPLSKMYIKAFCKKYNGNVMFYKDGYTDIIGRFNYISAPNSSSLSSIRLFSILVMGDSLGSLILESPPPKLDGKTASNPLVEGLDMEEGYNYKC